MTTLTAHLRAATPEACPPRLQPTQSRRLQQQSQPPPQSPPAVSWQPTSLHFPLALSSIASVDFNCPAFDDEICIILHSESFTHSCSTILNGGDWVYMVVYHYTDYLEARSGMNWFSGEPSKCTAVEFFARSYLVRWRPSRGAILS